MKTGGFNFIFKTRVHNVHDLVRCWNAPRKLSETENDMFYKSQLNLRDNEPTITEIEQLKTIWRLFEDNLWIFFFFFFTFSTNLAKRN